jgi:hypothetical protein
MYVCLSVYGKSVSVCFVYDCFRVWLLLCLCFFSGFVNIWSLLWIAEDTLWSGGPSDWNNPRARELLPQVRELVWAGKFAEATALSRQMVGPDTQVWLPVSLVGLNDS